MAATPSCATGPWTGPGLDKDYLVLTKWEVGGLLECQVYHDDFESAGSVIMIVRDQPVKERKVYERSCVSCEDSYYKHYVEIQTGANPGLYLLAQTGRGGTKGRDSHSDPYLPVASSQRERPRG